MFGACLHCSPYTIGIEIVQWFRCVWMLAYVVAFRLWGTLAFGSQARNSKLSTKTLKEIVHQNSTSECPAKTPMPWTHQTPDVFRFANVAKDHCSLLKVLLHVPQSSSFVLVLPSLTPFDPLPPTPSTSVGASFAGSWANISWLLENLDCGLKHNIGRKKHALATILWVTAWPVLNFPDLLQLQVLHPFAHRTKQEKEHWRPQTKTWSMAKKDKQIYTITYKLYIYVWHIGILTRPIYSFSIYMHVHIQT